jgi:hypothetical protein
VKRVDQDRSETTVTNIPKYTLLFPDISPEDSIRWLVGVTGRDVWLRRAKDLLGLGYDQRSILERHHVELCIAQGLEQIDATGKFTLLEQPFIDAVTFAGVAHTIQSYLTSEGRKRHAGKIKQALKEDYGFAALRTEHTAIMMSLAIGCDVTLADFENLGRYDFLIADQEKEVELECKLLTHDFAQNYRKSEFDRLCRSLGRHERASLLRPGTSRIAELTLKQTLPRKDQDLKLLASSIASAVADQPHQLPDYVESLRIKDWPLGVNEPGRAHAEARFITVMKGQPTFALHGERSAFILAVDSATDKTEATAELILRKFKDAASQLSGTRPGIVFAEVEGPCFDHVSNLQLKKVIDISLQRGFFKARPFVELVVIGFPGPPFTVGSSSSIRNPRIKRRNMSLISKRLERASRPVPLKNFPFKDFRMDWWKDKYRWEHKSIKDVKEALQDVRSKYVKKKPLQHK